jgi:D-glycero-alpha-D-manno-heptose 1-phosphate guanylyltransferase
LPTTALDSQKIFAIWQYSYKLKTMKAIILAGGLGSRLKHVLPNVPKPMADINGTPFLELLINYLKKQGFEEFTLSVCHMKEQIIEHFKGVNGISFAIENEPLDTGGAILNSIKLAGVTGNVAVLNGDSMLKINYREFFKTHGDKNFSIAIREVEDTSRYGRIEIKDDLITEFKEKNIAGRGYINSGYYILNAYWFLKQNLPDKFSIESDFLLPRIKEIKAGYFKVSDHFIDIGIP